MAGNTSKVPSASVVSAPAKPVETDAAKAEKARKAAEKLAADIAAGKRDANGNALNSDGTPRAAKRDTVYLLATPGGGMLFIDPEKKEARWITTLQEMGKIAFAYPADKYIRAEFPVTGNQPGWVEVAK